MPQIVQILPALRQSSVETAACPRAYVEIHINGKEQPDSIPSERGTDIHHVMSEYVRHCVAKQVSSDWEFFNTLSVAAGPVAGPILDGIRDIYEVDWEHVYGTEVTLALDEDFNPASFTMDADTGEVNELPTIPGVTYSLKPAAHIGTLDLILLSDGGDRGMIPDYKSHPAPFDADTFQSTLYPFLLMRHFPSLAVVTFELDFVRYVNCRRSVQWKREEMPAMQAEISRARARQRATHADPDNAKALPSKVCVYCPLAKDLTCPIAEYNEYTSISPVQRVMWKVWLGKMAYINTPLLKEFVQVTGPISYEDGNGRKYEYSHEDVAETRYPLDRTSIQAFEEWRTTTGEDMLDGRFNISSTKLKSQLKTRKRSTDEGSIGQVFENSIIERATKPKWAIRSVEGIEEDFNPYAEN